MSKNQVEQSKAKAPAFKVVWLDRQGRGNSATRTTEAHRERLFELDRLETVRLKLAPTSFGDTDFAYAEEAKAIRAFLA